MREISSAVGRLRPGRSDSQNRGGLAAETSERKHRDAMSYRHEPGDHRRIAAAHQQDAVHVDERLVEGHLCSPARAPAASRRLPHAFAVRGRQASPRAADNGPGWTGALPTAADIPRDDAALEVVGTARVDENAQAGLGKLAPQRLGGSRCIMRAF